MKNNSFNLFFETLATKLRVDILAALRDKPKTVTEICEIVKQDQSKVSHNLKRLRDCKFITAKRKGKNVIYSLNEETIVPLLKLVEKHVKKCCCSFCGKETCGRRK